jgi:hypothetical protein
MKDKMFIRPNVQECTVFLKLNSEKSRIKFMNDTKM